MKPLTYMGIALAVLSFSGTVWADDHCTDPVADWQPREVLRQQLEQRGWTVHRIKVDDGCYEVKGVDQNGNAFKAKYAPASLRIQKLEIKFDHDGDAAEYLKQSPNHQAK